MSLSHTGGHSLIHSFPELCAQIQPGHLVFTNKAVTFWKGDVQQLIPWL